MKENINNLMYVLKKERIGKSMSYGLFSQSEDGSIETLVEPQINILELVLSIRQKCKPILQRSLRFSFERPENFPEVHTDPAYVDLLRYTEISEEEKNEFIGKMSGYSPYYSYPLNY
jgi:hypothetical protein